MRILSTKDSRTLWLGRIARPYSFASPTCGAEFALLLIVADAEIEPGEQHQLSEQLVRSGCRHAACSGPSSSEWDDSIDMVWVMDEVEGRRAGCMKFRGQILWRAHIRRGSRQDLAPGEL